MNVDITPTFHALAHGEPLIFHCHHYNLFLQQTILDAGRFLDAEQVLVQAGAEVAYTLLEKATAGLSAAEAWKEGAAIFAQLGFGTLPLDWDLGSSSIALPTSHYALGFKARESRNASDPLCYFAAGYLQALVARVRGVSPGCIEVKETSCVACGDAHCNFAIEQRLEGAMVLRRSHGLSACTEPVGWDAGQWGNINPGAVVEAVAGLPLGGNEEGMIPAFGVLLTRHFANYYNAISYAMLDGLYRADFPHGRDLLVEAGHVCAFNTFGGIMTSPEWDAVVRPQIQDRSDWIYGIAAVVNALGWGQWHVQELIPDQKLVVRIHNGYEARGYLAHNHRSEQPQCFLAQGGVGGLMNLLYKADIDTGPALTQALYNQHFRAGEMFVATETKCACKGDEYCEFVAEKTTV